ncbi:acyl-CoA synthetase [Falsirhodobacter sp. 20TX0035]|uniref:acyl-CoA synthetase n=1 Tax=Falsirhodobacter sp. 20TX0035 TaxID=3022019 RepID=UPI00233084CA|nr:acyl-CoA synthetase [Falsirhodobacter sp. 20TX0035]MDB6453383.1 acyl-CoA synthetase [Falsirhodobacter sp. 20TX0035]
MPFATQADRDAIEAEGPWSAQDVPATIHRALALRDPARPALSFQLLSGPRSRAITWTWGDLHRHAVQAANLFRSLGVGPKDTVAIILPNVPEMASALLGGMIAGVAAPINPLLGAGQMASLLRDTGARVVVTLKAFPSTDIAAKVAEALIHAPGVRTVLEVDLLPYLAPPKSWAVPLLRPRHTVRHRADVTDFARAAAAQPPGLTFPDPEADRVAACFHTGGTTGMPKLARHRVGGMLYNGWVGRRLLFTDRDVILCPLPLFHVFAAYPVLMSSLMTGAHVVLPTPAGYRGKGVFDNLWKLIERWGATYLVAVPTALSVLMQRKVDADVSSLRVVFSGSAPLPRELFTRFKTATGVEVIEGYGLTEATCLIAANPPDGEKKVGSVGLAMPYAQVRIDAGEIVVNSPGTDGWLRTGDLGRIDADGYIFITGRAKDLIIRGGHNIDPAEIEEALMAHPAVAMVGAIGQPDAHAGEVPCAYVELVAGATATPDELREFARARISERAAVPRHVEILPEMPKTAVGKVFKPDLRRRAITRVFDAAMEGRGRVVEVVEDRERGLVARVEGDASALGGFTVAWEAAGAPSP